MWFTEISPPMLSKKSLRRNARVRSRRAPASPADLGQESHTFIAQSEFKTARFVASKTKTTEKTTEKTTNSRAPLVDVFSFLPQAVYAYLVSFLSLQDLHCVARTNRLGHTTSTLPAAQPIALQVTSNVHRMVWLHLKWPRLQSLSICVDEPTILESLWSLTCLTHFEISLTLGRRANFFNESLPVETICQSIVDAKLNPTLGSLSLPFARLAGSDIRILFRRYPKLSRLLCWSLVEGDDGADSGSGASIQSLTLLQSYWSNFETISIYFPALISLDLSNVLYVPSVWIERLLPLTPTLERLTLTNCLRNDESLSILCGCVCVVGQPCTCSVSDGVSSPSLANFTALRSLTLANHSFAGYFSCISRLIGLASLSIRDEGYRECDFPTGTLHLPSLPCLIDLDVDIVYYEDVLGWNRTHLPSLRNGSLACAGKVTHVFQGQFPTLNDDVRSEVV